MNSENLFKSPFDSPPNSTRFNFTNPRGTADQTFPKCFGPFGSSNGTGNMFRSKPPDVQKSLACSLEDLYNGANKRLNISRNVIDLSRKLQTIEEIVTVEIKPGWKNGTKITFAEKGNEDPGFKAADLIIVIDEQPHDVFTREGNDLIINQKIKLLEALTGKTIKLTTLDGRNLVIPVKEIVKPGYELTLPNEGMPIAKEPTKKGNLVIKFDVEYPTMLTTKQKYLLGKALAGNP